jgi:Domain of unknown function (DUF222)
MPIDSRERHPDGDFSDVDRARRRHLILGRQQADGMSTISGLLDPEARATIDAVLAKWAAPGMCNPDDEHPCVDGTVLDQSEGGVDAIRMHVRILSSAPTLIVFNRFG